MADLDEKKTPGIEVSRVIDTSAASLGVLGHITRDPQRSGGFREKERERERKKNE